MSIYKIAKKLAGLYRAEDGPQNALQHARNVQTEIERLFLREIERVADKTKAKYGVRINPRTDGSLHQRSVAYFLTFYLSWLMNEGIALSSYDYVRLTDAAAVGMVGYEMLDLLLDGNRQHTSREHSLATFTTIQNYEYQLLTVFGFTTENIGLIDAGTTRFIDLRIAEKDKSGISSLYTLDQSEMCGWKFGMIFYPFELGLRSLGREVEAYRRVFSALAAGLQILDDIEDLRKDLRNRHYSLIVSGLEDRIRDKSFQDAEKIVLEDFGQMNRVRMALENLMNRATYESLQLADPVWEAMALLVGRMTLSWGREIESPLFYFL